MRKNRITESDIRRLVRKVIKESDIEEGWDDEMKKSRYDDYNPSKFRRLPKDIFQPGMTDVEGTELMSDEDDEEYNPYFEDDFNIDDFLSDEDEDFDLEDDGEYA